MPKSIKQQMLSGVFYTAIAKYSGIVISLVITAILARLILPEEFGVVTTASVIIAFFSLFTSMGIGTAIIQKKELTEEDLNRIFSFTVWSGVVIALLFFVASWPIADFYEQPILRTLCQLLSVNLFFASANIVPNACFYKNKEFKFIAIRSFGIQLVVGVVSVVAALLGAGVYALIISPIASSILYLVVSLYRYPQKLQFTWGISSIRKIFSYSAYQFLFSVINYFSRNCDKLLIGKAKDMGMADLGYYDKSYRLMMLPLENITHVITPVMHPILSDLQNDREHLIRSYEKLVKLLGLIGMPLGVLLYFVAEELTLIVFGPNWMPSVPVFQILALSVGIQIIMSSSGSIYQASGDTRSLFICGVFSATINVAGILLGVFYFGELTMLAGCIVTTFTINFIQCYWQMYYVTFRRSLRFFFAQIYRPILLALLLAVCLYPVYQWMVGMNMFITLGVKSILALLIWLAFVHLTHEYDIIAEARKIIGKVRRH
ncbi:MAG: lipopolysaccharide biosynthesis protein [Prevotellaceae bacterium]|jgi:PST family polysaccharide transporter|nr:lipopolysaccharide biosynthesis protein [Prevotellaceae bacterium]